MRCLCSCNLLDSGVFRFLTHLTVTHVSESKDECNGGKGGVMDVQASAWVIDEHVPGSSKNGRREDALCAPDVLFAKGGLFR